MQRRTRSLLVVNCGQLLTLRGPHRPRVGGEMANLGLIRNAALLIRGQVVAAAGPEERLARSPEARGADRLDAGGGVVLPGFVDSHTHALFAAPRLDEYEARLGGATEPQAAKVGGIQASARHLRSASRRMLETQLANAIRWFVEHGTTTAEVKSGYGLDVEPELKMLRAIDVVAARSPFDLIPTLLVHDVPIRLKRQRTRYLQLVLTRLIPQVARQGIAVFFDVFCDRGYFTVAEARTLLNAAARSGLTLKLHAEQLAHTGAARMAAGMGALSVDHLDHLTPSDIPCLSESGTIATLLPGTVLHLGAGRYPPARRLIEASVPVALATNFNPGSSPTPSMQIILSLACSQMRMSPAEAITAATINGAFAVGQGDRVGSLEAGKQADLSIMDVQDYREIPYFFGVNHCVTTIKKGRLLYRRQGARER